MMPNKQVIAAVLLLAFLLGIGVGGTVNGWIKDIEIKRIQLDHSRKSEELALKNSELTERVHKAERDLNEQDQRSTQKLAEVKANAQADFDNRIERIRHGDQRLSVATRRCYATADANAGAAAADTQARAELEPEAAARILTVGKDGDDAILELNACIDKYNAAREQLKTFLTQSH